MNTHSSHVISPQILFDEYAIKKNAEERWNRPSEADLDVFDGKGGALVEASRILANELKVLYIFNPEVYVDPGWLINNPRLFYLTWLCTESSKPDPDCILPVLLDRFFKVYWTGGKIKSFEEFYLTCFPKRRSKGQYLPSSWISVCYQNKRFFESRIRKYLKKYVDLLQNHTDKVLHLKDPGEVMLKNIGRFKASLDHLIAQYVDANPSEFKDVILATLDEAFHNADRVSMTIAEATWRTIAINQHRDCDPYVVDWVFREGLYLPSHTETVGGIPVSRSSISADVNTIPQAAGGRIIRKGEFHHLDWDGPSCLISQERILPLSNYIGRLSFETIRNEIRNPDRCPAYGDYIGQLRDLEKINDPTKRLIACYDAVAELFTAIVPVLHIATQDEIFAVKGRWKFIEWSADHIGTLSGLIGPVAGGLGAVYQLASGGHLIDVGFSLLVGTLAGGLAAMKPLEPFYKEGSKFFRRKVGHHMLEVIGKIEVD